MDLTLIDFYKQFPDEKTCMEYLAKLRWGDKPICVHCGSIRPYTCESRPIYKCPDCGKQFTVRIGTIFEESRIPLQKWFLAVYLLTSLKKGVSSITISKYLGITQKSAWFMLQRIRYAMTQDSIELDGEVEIDETYTGNREGGVKSAGRGTKKIPIIGLVERGGSVKTYVAPFVGTEVIEPLINNTVKKTATIYTDYYPMYKYLITNMGYKHERINHSKGEYVKGKIHTNTIEGSWDHLKLGLKAIYMGVSPKHLQKYCDEFAFRYNTRDLKDGERFDKWLTEVNHKRLTYKQLTR